MKRRKVSVLKSRIEDIDFGDVVNRVPDAEKGWFMVANISVLFDGNIQLADETENITLAGGAMDIVGLQILEEYEIDDTTGLMVKATAAPMVVQAAPGIAPLAAVPPLAAQQRPTQPEPAAEPEQKAELPAIVAEATPPTGGSNVNLAVVADLLANLAVEEEAPQVEIKVEAETRQIKSNRPRPVRAKPAPEPSPEAVGEPAVPMPAGARPVYGDELPDAPSYKNPVVVDEPDAQPLPKRGRVA